MAEPSTDNLYANYRNVFKNAEEGKVVTRFPPEPSGYLHIGHVKAAMLNFHYAKIYKGRMLLRFDDTNPSKENQEFADSIRSDINLLEIYPDAESHTSDYFNDLQQYMRQMITAGHAYLDNTPVEQMRNERNEGIESSARGKSVEQNLQEWERFLQGELKEYCVRAKIDMQNPNKCLRDPVFYRYNELPHIRTGSQFKVYPTYDFACPIVDSIEGVTHTIRTSEYNDRNAMYEWVLDTMQMRKPTIYDISRLSFVNTCLSKRKLQRLVDTGVVEGWEDPRFPTVRGILRRGLQPFTLKQFMLEQGPSRSTVLMDWTILWAKNKQYLDPIVPRYTAISTEDACICEITNGSAEPYVEEHPFHPKNQSLGMSVVHYSNRILMEGADILTITQGEKITLMKLGNAYVESIEETVGEFQGVQTRYKMVLRLDLADKDYKKTKKFTWLAALPDLLILPKIVEFDVLINKEKIEDGDDIDAIVNRNSRFETQVWASSSIEALNPGQCIQFERKGYFRLDSPQTFFKLPEGNLKGKGKVDSAKLAQGTGGQQQSARAKQRAERKAKKAEAKEKVQEEKKE